MNHFLREGQILGQVYPPRWSSLGRFTSLPKYGQYFNESTTLYQILHHGKDPCGIPDHSVISQDLLPWGSYSSLWSDNEQIERI